MPAEFREKIKPILPAAAPYSSKIALRMPDAVKEAATALSKCLLYELNSDETLNARGPTSMNDMVVELIWRGLEQYVEILDAEIDRALNHIKPFSELAALAMADPSKAGFVPNDAQIGSPAHLLLKALADEYPDSRLTLTRAEVLGEFAAADRIVSDLFSARSAVAAAVAANHRPHW